MSLNGLTNILKSFRKGNIVYRFKELDDMFLNNPFISNYWVEFKNTLVFNEGISLKGAPAENSSIQCTVDSSYFFNEETLINSKLNYKFSIVVLFGFTLTELSCISKNHAFEKSDSWRPK